MDKGKKYGLTVYTDGACSGNPGPGGWGFYIPYLRIEGSGGSKDTTNNRMELQAVTEGLRYLAGLEANCSCSITITTDSKYVSDAFNKSWLVNWERNGWKTASGSQVKNQDLWRDLLKMVRFFREEGDDIYFTWVKGHAGNPYNVLVDNLACQARDKAKEAHEIDQL